jgi:phenylacetate-coenzyme A ligase PaaK-like adenylate-forming protein
MLERCGGFQPAHPALSELRRRVSDRLHRACGLTVELTIVAPHTIPRSEGKAVRVVERGVEKR